MRMHIYSRGQNSLPLMHCPCARDPAAPEREDPQQYIFRKTAPTPPPRQLDEALAGPVHCSASYLGPEALGVSG